MKLKIYALKGCSVVIAGSNPLFSMFMAYIAYLCLCLDNQSLFCWKSKKGNICYKVRQTLTTDVQVTTLHMQMHCTAYEISVRV